MRLLTLCLLAFAAVFVASSKVEAGFASSILQVSDLRFERQVSPGVWVAATSTEIPFLTSSTSSTSSATYTGFSQVSHSADGFFDVGRSFLQAAPAAPVSTPNSFVSNGQAQNYSVGDTHGLGSLIIAGGIQASSIGEVNALGNQSGTSLATIATGGAFVPGVSGVYRIALTVNGSLTVINSTESNAQAGVGLGANVNTVGVGGGVMTNLLPPNLNQVVSTNVSTTFNNLSIVSDSFSLAEGTPYSFNINQSTSASVTAVPEPTSLLLLGTVGAVGVVVRRMRKHKVVIVKK
jgi:hypothetical protein